jgi:galactokinase
LSRSPEAPTAEVFAPGRVNLIGEHIDYHGLSVLPMALERGVRILFSPLDEPRVVLENADPSFAPVDFAMGPGVTRGPPGDWGNYVKAAALVASERFGCRRGITGRVASDLPPAAGLSSSSALVVATALALLYSNDVPISFLELAEAAAKGEQFVGTAGGGMDQAASLLGRKGHAIRIGFSPLAARAVPIPRDWTVLVAHSGVEAAKSGGAQEAYNLRRAESTRGLAEVAERLGIPDASPWELLSTQPPDLLFETAAALEEPRAAWVRHVLAEARRVDEAEAALVAGDLEAFGHWVTASHRSLRDDYQVSHPRLDRLVEAALDAGAAGARLTGAGFGGCMLAVCDGASRGPVARALADELDRSGAGGGLRPFVARPGAGAFVGTR